MVKRYKPKNKKFSLLRKKEGLKMPAILKKEETNIQDNLSTFHTMVLSREKRQEIFDYYDSKYQETQDADNIFKGMKTRRKLEK